MTMRPAVGVILAAVFAVQGCAAQRVEQARESLIGHPVGEARSCLGIPTHAEADVMQWDYQEPLSTSALPLSDLLLLPIAWPVALAGTGTVTLGVSRSCHAIATVRDGIIRRLVLSGDNGGLSGRGAACEPMFRGCTQ